MQKPLHTEKHVIKDADDADIFHARKFFGDGAAENLAKSVAEKRHKANVIQVAGVDRYLVIWHKDAQNRLFVNCVVERNGGGMFPQFLAGLKQLARENACYGLAGTAIRDGLVKKLVEAGWQVKGISVEYDF